MSDDDDDDELEVVNLSLSSFRVVISCDTVLDGLSSDERVSREARAVDSRTKNACESSDEDGKEADTDVAGIEVVEADGDDSACDDEDDVLLSLVSEVGMDGGGISTLSSSDDMGPASSSILLS